MFPPKKKMSKKQVAAVKAKSKGKGKRSVPSTSKAGSKPGFAAKMGATMMGAY